METLAWQFSYIFLVVLRKWQPLEAMHAILVCFVEMQPLVIVQLPQLTSVLEAREIVIMVLELVHQTRKSAHGSVHANGGKIFLSSLFSSHVWLSPKAFHITFPRDLTCNIFHFLNRHYFGNCESFMHCVH